MPSRSRMRLRLKGAGPSFWSPEHQRPIDCEDRNNNKRNCSPPRLSASWSGAPDQARNPHLTNPIHVERERQPRWKENNATLDWSSDASTGAHRGERLEVLRGKGESGRRAGLREAMSTLEQRRISGRDCAPRRLLTAPCNPHYSA